MWKCRSDEIIYPYFQLNSSGNIESAKTILLLSSVGTLSLFLLFFILLLPCTNTKHLTSADKTTQHFVTSTPAEWCRARLYTYIVVFGGPVWVLLCVEESLYFSFFVISSLLLFGQTLPLWTHDNTRVCLLTRVLQSVLAGKREKAETHSIAYYIIILLWIVAGLRSTIKSVFLLYSWWQ